ncbi:Rhodanese-related sulfurtransferase [Natronorubrum sediminis]|uniref:Rhodanese-related sulfurtransferase n=1 Tax=Natronorubrum sediminis TaxID=640943 RepID=A0A1H6G5C8_9EURY|nr:rhodanese-like domain-containing protein [Natronorubrum sediminis]SEH17658.1 Rhodanese-related sulfurtransferase [Natronorubrum sediminis]
MPSSLSPDRLASAIESTDPLAVLDIREPLDYANGHVRECTPVHRPVLEERLATLVPNRSTPIVLCDRSGDRAPLDTAWLVRNGYKNVSFLEGGMAAWEAAGNEVIEAIDGVPHTGFDFTSKEFGERVEAEERLSKLTPEEFDDLSSAEPLTVDVRTPEEYADRTIPRSVNLEGVDAALYAETLRRDEERPLVVHCAGRTRSIIGVATLEKLGLENVYALENGTMGWELADQSLEENPDRRSPDLDVDGERRERLRRSVEKLLADTDVELLDPLEIERLEAAVDERQTVYRIDVRTEAEYADGHLPNAVSVPGGQAIQTAERHIAVRDAEIVFVSDDHVRSAITAYWFDEMGFENVTALEGGVSAWMEAGRDLTTDSPESSVVAPALLDDVGTIAPEQLERLRTNGRVAIRNVDASGAFRDRHIPGSKWVPRYELEAHIRSNETSETLVLTCDDGSISRAAGAMLVAECDRSDVRVLRGGVEAWADAEQPLADGETGLTVEPRDDVYDLTGEGFRDNKRAYLEWEERLVE